MRWLAAAESGTGSLLGAALGSYRDSEQALARGPLESGCFGPRMLVLADRKFLSWALTAEFLAVGAHILWRASAYFTLKTVKVLADGTYLAELKPIIPLADAKARLSAVLDDVRDTHDRVVITRNGRPEAVIISVADLETIEETLDLLSTPGAIDEIRTAEAEIARGEAIGADELRRLMAERVRNERNAG